MTAGGVVYMRLRSNEGVEIVTNVIPFFLQVYLSSRGITRAIAYISLKPPVVGSQSVVKLIVD